MRHHPLNVPWYGDCHQGMQGILLMGENFWKLSPPRLYLAASLWTGRMKAMKHNAYVVAWAVNRLSLTTL